MLKIDEIVKAADLAVNMAVAHYFTNLASGEGKKDEASFVAEIMKSSQVWLFFTETAMEELKKSIYRSAEHINLVYNLSALFHQRFLVSEEEYKAYIGHLAWSFDTSFREDDSLSLMATEYRDRLIDRENMEILMTSNRPWAFLASLILHLDTNVLIESLGPKK